MKKIAKELRTYCENYLNNLKKDNPELCSEIKSKLFIAGGAITSLILGETPNDIDFYINNEDNKFDRIEKLKQYYYDKYISKNLVEKNENSKAKLVSLDDSYPPHFYKNLNPVNDFDLEFWSPSAITLKNKYQIITRSCDNPSETIDSFDFSHCVGYYSFSDDVLFISNEMYKSISTKTLFYRTSLYPFSAILRMKKFLTRGWKINTGNILKIAIDLSKFNITDVNSMARISNQIYDARGDFDEFEELSKNISEREINEKDLFKLIDEIFEETTEFDYYRLMKKER